MKKHELMLISFSFMLILSLLIVMYQTPQAKANRCIAQSEGTDTDICECLHLNGLEDNMWCK